MDNYSDFSHVKYYQPSGSDEEQRNTKAQWPTPPSIMTKKGKKGLKKRRAARAVEVTPELSPSDSWGVLADGADKPKEEEKQDSGEEVVTAEEKEASPIEEQNPQDGGIFKDEEEAVGVKNTAMGVEDSDAKEEASFGADNLTVDSLATPRELLSTTTPPGEEEVPSDEDGKVGATRNQRGFIWPQSVQEAPQLEDDAMAQSTGKYRSRLQASASHQLTQNRESAKYLPFKAQHQLMMQLQSYLEHVFYTFAKRNAPEMLSSSGWSCAEAASLCSWSDEVFHLQEEKFDDDPSGKTAQDLHRLMVAIQGTAVNRTPAEVATIREYLRGAEAIVKFPKVEDCRGVANQLRSSVDRALDEYSQNGCFAQKRLDKRLREIEDARAQLDQQEKTARAELQGAEDYNRDLAAAKILEAAEEVQAILGRVDSGLGNWDASKIRHSPGKTW